MRRSCRTLLNSPSVISDDVWKGIVPPQSVMDDGGVGRPAITMYPVYFRRNETQSARAAMITENVPVTPAAMRVHTKKNPPLDVAIAGYLVPLM